MSDLLKRMLVKKAEAEREALLKGIMARYTALYVGGPSHPISRRPGDNMPGWPLTFGHTSSFKDHISGVLDRGTQYHNQGILFRLWHLKDEAKAVDELIRGFFNHNFEHLKKEWWEAGPVIDLNILMLDLHGLLARHSIVSMDDIEVQNHWARVALTVRGGKIAEHVA